MISVSYGTAIAALALAWMLGLGMHAILCAMAQRGDRS